MMDYFSRGPLKHLQIKGEFCNWNQKSEGDKIYVEFLKVFLHPPPPLEGKSIIRKVEFIILKMIILSIQKRTCENYLFH